MTVLKVAIPLLVLPLLSMRAFGDDINCQSEYGNVTLDDDVVIAAPCTFNGTNVDGKITIFAGGSLTAIDATIDGNIKARDADFLNLQNSEVDGNVELRNMVGDDINIRDSVIDGRIVLKKNRSRLEIHNNYVGKRLEVEENGGGVIITENLIDDDLECKGNTPEPNGGNNQVSGKREGQCRNLEAAELPTPPENEGPTGQPEPPTSTPGDSNTPPLVLNTGTGGGGVPGPLLIALLFIIYVFRSRQSLL